MPHTAAKPTLIGGEAAAYVPGLTHGNGSWPLRLSSGDLRTPRPPLRTHRARHMKTSIACTLAAIYSCLTYAQKPDNMTEPWPMFQRPDVVTLAGKEIPDAYKRTKITDSQGRILEGEWLSIDTKAKTVKFRRGSDAKEFDIPFASLCPEDRLYAELETGSQWDPGDALKGLPNPVFDPKEPMIKERGTAPKGVFYAASNAMLKTYTPEEVLHHLQARTLTSSFVRDYDNEWRGHYTRDDPKMYFGSAAHTRNLAEVVPTLSLTEENGNVSLKARIDMLGLALYEEHTVKNPRERELDYYAGDLPQVCHFVAQYIRLSNGKEKVPYMTLIQANTQGYATPYHNDAKKNIFTALEKAHQVKVWWHPRVFYGSNLPGDEAEEFHKMITQRLVRNHIRNNKPVVVTLADTDTKTGYAVIIGYALESGKPSYETLILYGPTRPSNIPRSTTPEYKAKIDSNYFQWSSAVFIE